MIAIELCGGSWIGLLLVAWAIDSYKERREHRARRLPGGS